MHEVLVYEGGNKFSRYRRIEDYTNAEVIEKTKFKTGWELYLEQEEKARAAGDRRQKT